MKRPALCLTRALCKTARPLLAGGVAFACFAAPAFAADLSPSEAPPVFSWSGLYVGFNNGYAWRDSRAFNTSGVNLFETPALPGLGLPEHLWGGRRRWAPPALSARD